MLKVICLNLIIFLSLQPIGHASEVAFMQPMPDLAKGTMKNNQFTLGNSAIEAIWVANDGQLHWSKLADKISQLEFPQMDKELFVLEVSGINKLPELFPASAFKLMGLPSLSRLVAKPGSVRHADSLAGWQVTATFQHALSGVSVDWRAELRDGSHYVRQILTVRGTQGTLRNVQGLNLMVGKADIVGKATAGNPLCTASLFMGLELPMSKQHMTKGENAYSICELDCQLPLIDGKAYEISSVIGCYPQGQRRRAFLCYLERERARPYKQFLHYNCWMDLNLNLNEESLLANIKAFTEEMTVMRGVAMQSYVVDDGWDNFSQGFWAIDKKKFPSGFTPLVKELDQVKSNLGIWISPLGGYGGSIARIGQAKKAGIITANSLDLAEAKYYAWFRDYCANLVSNNKVNYFKWDKAGDGASPHFMALLACATELRQLNPDLFFNITVGTWPSPFWLNVIDCTWRGKGDIGFEGPGNQREQWITYRDAQTWRGVTSVGPLYPLNSIMNHGIILANGTSLTKKMFTSGTDMKHEARSYFGSGTALQELYVQPSITPSEAWDHIAAGAKWSRANADILVDTHWVGGNPTKGQKIYGWASWSPRKGLLTLRNPGAKDGQFELDVAQVFELPSFAAIGYTVTSAYADAPSPITKVEAGKPIAISLKPFEVLVLEMTPIVHGK